MRLFVAINLETAARDAIAQATAPLREAAPSVRWTPPERVHLTLKFLGEQADPLAGELARALDDAAERHAAFPLEIAGLGAFPNQRRPRIVWAGVRADPRLELLHHDVELACSALGLPLEGRAFRPHVTIGRAERLAATELEPLTRAARAVRVGVTSHVGSVDLMHSELSPRGARHTLVAAATLREA